MRSINESMRTWVDPRHGGLTTDGIVRHELIPLYACPCCQGVRAEDLPACVGCGWCEHPPNQANPDGSCSICSHVPGQPEDLSPRTVARWFRGRWARCPAGEAEEAAAILERSEKARAKP